MARATIRQLDRTISTEFAAAFAPTAWIQTTWRGMNSHSFVMTAGIMTELE